MLEIDGSKKSGSGTILRLSLALSGIIGKPIHIYNIRKKRKQPGLRPQHLESVKTIATLCNAEIKGAKLGSEEIWFEPNRIKGGEFRSEIGTAGSIPMLIMTVLPICIFAPQPTILNILKGGTDVKNAPTINFLRHILFPILERMGIKVKLDIKKYGYYPKGMGEVILKVEPCKKISSIKLEKFGILDELGGLSVCTNLSEKKVGERQAKEAKKLLQNLSFFPKIQIINDFSDHFQKGSSLVLWAKTDSGVLLGGDAIGEIGKSSENVAKEAVDKLLKPIGVKATVDQYVADMLVPYLSLANGMSTYLSPTYTDHLESNIWIANEVLGAKFKVEKKEEIYRIIKE